MKRPIWRIRARLDYARRVSPPLSASGKGQTALRVALFRQNCVPESLKITNIHAILGLVLTKEILTFISGALSPKAVMQIH